MPDTINPSRNTALDGLTDSSQGRLWRNHFIYFVIFLLAPHLIFLPLLLIFRQPSGFEGYRGDMMREFYSFIAIAITLIVSVIGFGFLYKSVNYRFIAGKKLGRFIISSQILIFLIIFFLTIIWMIVAPESITKYLLELQALGALAVAGYQSLYVFIVGNIDLAILISRLKKYSRRASEIV